MARLRSRLTGAARFSNQEFVNLGKDGEEPRMAADNRE